METYYLRSFGCQMNEHDAERIRAVLEDHGLTSVESPEDAGVIVYNTCTVRESANERFAGHMGSVSRIKRTDPERLVIITGCLPQAEQQALFAAYPFVDAAIGPQNLDRLAEILVDGALRPQGFFDDRDVFSGDLAARRLRSFQAWVQVMSGCTNFCAYCIVPFVRGPERSRASSAVIAEVGALVADGVREVTLLGQNVNAYGADLTGSQAQGDFADLLREIGAVEGLRRVRFMTSHPRDLSDRLIAAIAEIRSVCEHVHLPAQSGSDAVLTAMRRGYTAETFLERLSALRAAVPDVSVTTDLIVGFPGETDEDFSATLALVRAAAFDGAFTFVYSPRSGTAAAGMTEQIPEAVKKARITELIAVTQEVSQTSRQRFVGRTVEVLVEGPSRQPGTSRGRTRHNMTVNFTGLADPGAIVDVVVSGATSTTLKGRLR